ncbi:MAG: hypothetical protein D6679_05890 [Candidatus Hydrogenedentota bacterium]|nr:MAG: hypothetical protein D6679_05890 [Candidatus Hydrogenedentota bacterium]
MDLELIRRVVEEEVRRAVHGRRTGRRIKRPVVSEEMVNAARRRKAAVIEIPANALITPAARERAKTLGISFRQEPVPRIEDAETRELIEAVFAAVVEEIGRRRERTGRVAASIDPMGKKVVTAEDVRSARSRGGVIRLLPGGRVTPLAADLAREYGVRIERVE